MKTDIDIDFADRESALSHLAHIAATIAKDGKYTRHNTGVYFQEIPVNPFTELASIPYQAAEELGYFKLDFLNNSIYQGIRDEAHLDALRTAEPAWELLDDTDFVEMLAHLKGHFNIVQVIKPKSVTDIAVCLALIRPGKRHLLNKSRAEIDNEIWMAPSEDTYYFKKAHAVSYALSIVVQMNYIVEQAFEPSDHE